MKWNSSFVNPPTVIKSKQEWTAKCDAIAMRMEIGGKKCKTVWRGRARTAAGSKSSGSKRREGTRRLGTNGDIRSPMKSTFVTRNYEVVNWSMYIRLILKFFYGFEFWLLFSFYQVFSFFLPSFQFFKIVNCVSVFLYLDSWTCVQRLIHLNFSIYKFNQTIMITFRQRIFKWVLTPYLVQFRTPRWVLFL